MVDWRWRKAVLATSKKLTQGGSCFGPKSLSFQDRFMQIDEAFKIAKLKLMKESSSSSHNGHAWP